METQSRLFVGRGDLVQEICGGTMQIASLYAVTGLPGVGKTALVSHLAEHLSARSHRVVRIGLQSFRSDGFTQNRDSISVAQQHSSFGHFCDLVLVICKQLGVQGKRRFRERVKAAKRNPIGVANPALVRGVLIIKHSENVRVEGTLNSAQPSLSAAVSKLVHEFSLYVAELATDVAEQLGSRSRRLYVLLDEFDTISSDVISEWVAALVRYLRDAVVVIAGRRDMPVPGGAVHRVLSNFTRAECGTYLRRRCGPQPAAAAGDSVYTFTGGNPQAVDIVADLVSRVGAEQVIGMLHSWNSAGPQTHFSAKLTELVDALLTAESQPISKEISSALIVVRRFDQRMLASIMVPDEPRVDPAGLYARLAQLPFVEPCADASGKFNAHRVHEFVRSVLLRDLTAYEPERLTQLHTRALAHYEQEIEEVKVVLGRENPFLEAVRYKNVRWQHLYSEWIYHLGHVAGTEQRSLARLLFADVYLDAFWWWGYYASSAFCDNLLHEWETVCQDELDWSLLDQLRRFTRAFPPGWGTRETGSPRWRDMTGALLWIRGLGHLDTIDPVSADPRLRHLRAVTSLFLAEAAQSSGDGLNVADRWYSDAHAMFDTDMGKDWTRSQQAEMWWEAGDHGHGTDLLKGVESRARERGDHELLGRLAIFTAFHQLARGETATAATHAALAVLHSFVFHVRQTLAPDEYSTEFHHEMLERSTKLLTTVAEQAGPTAWSEAALDIQKLLLPLRQFTADPASVPDRNYVQTVSELVGHLPRLPLPAELHDPGSDYVRLIRWVEVTMRDELERPVSP